jgi:16S rRNA processing protein RimM
LLEVGRITKPHGLQGEVLVKLSTTETSRLDPGSVVFAGDRQLVVRRAKVFRDRWIVDFEGVGDREGAERLRGELLRAEPLVDVDEDPETFWVHELFGVEVVDVSGRSHGRVETVQENPASDLLVLESGALVPLTFVTGWLERGERLEIDPPEGLFDL